MMKSKVLSVLPFTASKGHLDNNVCLFIAARAIFQLSDGFHHYRWQGCKFRPMLSTYGLLQLEFFLRAIPSINYCDTGPWFILSHPKDRQPHPIVEFEPAS
jgi:hypothetical protein